jgi:transposase
LFFDLPGFQVVSCEQAALGLRRVVVMQADDEHGCPRCWVFVGGRPYDLREMRIKDLPMGHRPLEVVWRKRRYRCRESACRIRRTGTATGSERRGG